MKYFCLIDEKTKEGVREIPPKEPEKKSTAEPWKDIEQKAIAQKFEKDFFSNLFLEILQRKHLRILKCFWFFTWENAIASLTLRIRNFLC